MQVQVIDAANLVVGDIVDVRSGDRVPADIRMIYTHEMKVIRTTVQDNNSNSLLYL